MNKKFSTLMAGFLLAGAVLSPAMAEKLSDVANNGKYYKMDEGAFISKKSGSTGEWTTEGARGWFLGLNAEGAAVISPNVNDFWKVDEVKEGVYALTSFTGTKLVVDKKDLFTLKEDLKDAEGNLLPFSQLKYNGGKNAVGYSGGEPYLVGKQELENGFGIAFDAVEESATSGDVNYRWFMYGLDGLNAPEAIYFAYNNGKGKGEGYDGKEHYNYYHYSLTNIFTVSYDESTKTYTFTDNKTGEDLIATGATANVKSFYVSKNDHGAYLQDPTSSKYVRLTIDEYGNVTGAELVDTEVEATYVGFKGVDDDTIPAETLNILEKDGFSVTIYYDKKDDCLSDEDHLATDIAGNPFKGHLTTMVWTGKEFKTPEKANTYNDYDFYLKNSNGFIVAQKYEGQGANDNQALYSFTTVSEADLKHYLIRKQNNLTVEVEYFGVFQASVDGVDFDADPTAITKVDRLTSLAVKVGEYTWATVGRYDFTTNKVPTLVASQSTELYQILISLGDREIVDWTTFVQGKFFTVEKKAGDGAKGLLLAKSNNAGYGFESSYSNVLEAEWALTVSFDDNGKADEYIFTNRENPNKKFTLAAQKLYYVSGSENTYKIDGEQYVIKAVDTEATDGYKVLDTDEELNQKWNIAFSSSVFGGKAYMTENHGEGVGASYHVIGLTTDVEKALEFSVKKYDGKFEKKENPNTHTYEYYPADTIYVVSELGIYNTRKKNYETVKDTLKVLAYTFVNQWNEPLAYGEVNASKEKGYKSLVTYKEGNNTYHYSAVGLAKAHKAAQKFAIRFDGESCYNLRPVEFEREMQKETALSEDWKSEMYQIFNQEGDLVKMYAGNSLNGILDNVDLYNRTENDLFVVEQTDEVLYRRLKNDVDTVSIYRNDNNKSLLYEKAGEVAPGVFAHFLGLENIADITTLNPAMLADTAYVRYETYKPQYMLAVAPTIHPAGKWCEQHQSATCEHAVPVAAWTEGRFLVNLVDSAYAWANAHVHQVGNPYRNTEGFNKLGFVQAIHRNDSLIVNGKPQFIGNNKNHIAKFQFRYVDSEDQSFVIETSADGSQTPGYLKWMNGVVVVIYDIHNADVYNMNEEESRIPTDNETIAASEVTVIAGEGQVTIANAAGKKVVISNILGQVVANTVLTSDNATVAAPQGVVVVAVEGEEAVKAIVK